MEPSTSTLIPDQGPALYLSTFTTTEKLILSQAVHQTGTNDFKAVSKILLDHALVKGKSKKSFSPEHCRNLFEALMKDMDLDATATLPANSPTLLKVARKYYLARVVEIREAMQSEFDQFKIIFSEIQNIKDGKHDSDFLREKEEEKKPKLPPSKSLKVPPRPGPIDPTKHVAVGKRRGRSSDVNSAAAAAAAESVSASNGDVVMSEA